jgi:hypothetical protein
MARRDTHKAYGNVETRRRKNKADLSMESYLLVMV